MWRRMRLGASLNVVFATLLALWFVADIARLLSEARPLANEESRGVTRLLREFFESSLANIQGADNPQQAIMSIVASVQYLHLRHVRVGLASNDFVPAVITPEEAGVRAPAWFQALVDLKTDATTLPIVVGGRRMGWIVIYSDPADAIEDVWDRVRIEMVDGVALGVALLAASTLFVSFALRPLRAAGETLARLTAGDFSARAPIGGSRELVDIGSRINTLGEALSELSAANRQLLERALDAHDEERKSIANELHDEIGPHLFALRAQAAMLANRLNASETAGAAVAAAAMRDAVESLQRQNRRILTNLRPAALDDLGLVAALEALVEHWRRAEPSVEISMKAASEIADLGPRASLTTYRFVQEALTNAYRHSGAKKIVASLAYERARSHVALSDPALAGLRVCVRDDGHGPEGPKGFGMGLAGMRDRVKALGGEFAFHAEPDGGATAEAWF